VDSAFEMSPGGLSEVDTRSIDEEPLTTDEDVIKEEVEEEEKGEKQEDKEDSNMASSAESSQMVPSGRRRDSRVIY
jgi:hypothetical protein